MDMLGFAAVPAIVVIVYLLAELFKGAVQREKLVRLIPPLCGLAGLALGVACYFLTPDLLPANDVITAAAIGAASGFAATGVNQALKQQKK